jgi:hypothetical protein
VSHPASCTTPCAAVRGPTIAEVSWPQIRTSLVADKIAARRNRAATARDHVDGYVPGGRCENINPPSQRRQLPYLRIISSLSNATDDTRELYVQQLWELLANTTAG